MQQPSSFASQTSARADSLETDFLNDNVSSKTIFEPANLNDCKARRV